MMMSQQRIIEKIAEQFRIEKYSVEKQIKLSKAYPDFVLNIEKYYDYMVKEKNEKQNQEYMNLEQNWKNHKEELKFTIIKGLIKLYNFLQQENLLTHGNIQPRNLVLNCGKVLLTNFGNESTDRKNFIRSLDQNQKQKLYPYLTKELLRICQKQSFQELNEISNESKQNADKEALAFTILEILFPQDFQNLKQQISIDKVLNDRDRIINNIQQITTQKFPFLAQNPNTLRQIKKIFRDHFNYHFINENENDFQFQEVNGLEVSQAFDQSSRVSSPILKNNECETPISTYNSGNNTKKQQVYFKLSSIQDDCIDRQNVQTPTTFRTDLYTLRVENKFQQETNLLSPQKEQQEAIDEKIEQQEQNQNAQLITQQQVVHQIVQQETEQIVQQKVEYLRQDTNLTVKTSNEFYIPLKIILFEQDDDQSQEVFQNDKDAQQQMSFSNQDQSNGNILENEDQQQLLQQNQDELQQPSESNELNLDEIDEPQSENEFLKIFQQRQSILKGKYQVGNIQNSENCLVQGDLIIKGRFQNIENLLNLETGNIIIFKEFQENNTKNKYIEVYEKVGTQRANYREPSSKQYVNSIYKKYKILKRENLLEFQLCFLYEGSIVKGIPNGHGKIQNYEKNFIYEGDWVGGKKQGNGTFKILNEQFYRQGCRWKYEGGFKNDKFHGTGKLYFKDDESIYEEGEFENHKQVGLHKRVKIENHCQTSNYKVLYINLCCNIGRIRIPFHLNFYENF